MDCSLCRSVVSVSDLITGLGLNLLRGIRFFVIVYYEKISCHDRQIKYNYNVPSHSKIYCIGFRHFNKKSANYLSDLSDIDNIVYM